MKRVVAFALVLVLALSLCGCDSMDYKEAMELFDAGDFEGARDMFVQLGDYEDSTEMVNKCDYELALECMELGEYSRAAEIFASLGSFEDSADKANECNYLQAEAYMEEGEYSKAAELFGQLGSYKDSAAKLEECQVMEIDALLQGSWESAITAQLAANFKFSNGRFYVQLMSISNEGSYRIDVKRKEIYVCYDYIISATGKTPNSEEQLMFNYTYDGTTLTLTSDTWSNITKK